MTKSTESRVTLYTLSLITINICRPIGSKELYLPFVQAEDKAPWIHISLNKNTRALCIKRAVKE